MKKPNLKKSVYFDFFASIVQFSILIVFPDLPPYITMLPGFMAVSFSIIIYNVRMYFYKKHIAIAEQLQNSINSLENSVRLRDAKLSKYDTSFLRIIDELFQCSLSASDKTEKEVLIRLHQYVDNTYTRLLVETERKKVNIHENSKDC